MRTEPLSSPTSKPGPFTFHEFEAVALKHGFTPMDMRDGEYAVFDYGNSGGLYSIALHSDNLWEIAAYVPGMRNICCDTILDAVFCVRRKWVEDAATRISQNLARELERNEH